MPWSIIGHVLLVDVMQQGVRHGKPLISHGVVGPAAALAGCDDDPQVVVKGDDPGNNSICPAGAQKALGLSGGGVARWVTVVQPVLVGRPRCWDVALIVKSVPN